MGEIKRYDEREQQLPFEPAGPVDRLLAAAARTLERRGQLWRANFTVSGRLGGRPLRVPLQFGAGWEHLRMREVWLYHAIEHLLKSRPGTFVDVGVNVGQTLIKVKAVEPDRDYVGFEPNPNCLQYVQHLITLNKFTHATVVPIAVSNRAGVLRLFLNPDVDPSATIVDGFREPDRYARSIVVPVFVGDEVLESIGVREVSIVKIDVEGGELDVMQGLERTLRRAHPFVVCEVLPVFDAETELGRFRAPRQAALRDLLGDLGYAIFRIYVDGTVEALSDFGGVHSDMTLSNYIFVPRADVSEFTQQFPASTRAVMAAAS